MWGRRRAPHRGVPRRGTRRGHRYRRRRPTHSPSANLPRPQCCTDMPPAERTHVRSWQLPKRHRRALASYGVNRLVAIAAAGALVAGCSGSPSIPPHTYPLWSDGWRAGQTAAAAALTGHFHARMTRQGACAWLGSTNAISAVRWPAGWRVRLHPAILFDQSGKVVAHEGDVLTVGGGAALVAHAGVRCGRPGQQIWDVEDGVRRGPLRPR